MSQALYLKETVKFVQENRDDILAIIGKAIYYFNSLAFEEDDPDEDILAIGSMTLPELLKVVKNGETITNRHLKHFEIIKGGMMDRDWVDGEFDSKFEEHFEKY